MVFLALALAALRVSAQQATLVGDAHVSISRPTVNAGGLSNLNVGNGYTALVQFDLGVLPAGTTAAQITRATLKVYCNRADTPGTVAVQTVGSAWNEASVTYATMPSLGPAVEMGQATLGEFVTFDVTSTVQAWVSAPATNHGLALNSSLAVVQFDSKENSQTSHLPQLEIALASVTSGGGVAGAIGATGSTGVQGVAGLVGATGLAGSMGAKGSTGASGATGAAGATGSAGIGLQGATGSTGAMGLAGATGVGLVGTTGATGSVGAPGLAGATGAAGFAYQGAYSSTMNYTLGDVVVFGGASYTSLIAANHGNTPPLSPSAWGTLTAQGATGPTGSAGPVGAQGATGSIGVTGPAGTVGSTGAQGVAGQGGAQGVQGVAGVTGATGAVGSQGIAGPVGLSFQGTYSSTTNYSLADGVLWQGAGWVSLIAGNHGNTPSTSPSAWSMFAASGSMGASGVTGAVGVTGSNGLNGANGATGVAGATGSTGATGTAGLVYEGSYSSSTNYGTGAVVTYGGASYVSLAGFNVGQQPGVSPSYWSLLAAQGGSGVQGVAGPVGATGAMGVAGPQGVVGLTGAQGVPGPQGPAGAQGLTGANGAVGPQGPQGLQGVAGQAGAQGIVGPAGPIGLQGIAGMAGPSGPTGPIGFNGTTGATGPTGLIFMGVYASNFNYGIGAVVTYQGTSYVSEAVGNLGQTPGVSPAFWQVLSAQGVSGAMGAQGVTGPTGITGAIGATGAQGVAGVAGTQGATGPQGPAGAQGLTGANGAVGAQGPQGLQGVAGQAGAQGTQGVAGATGPQGPAGVAGASGVTGQTGSVGSTGAVGINFRSAWTTSTNYAVNDVVTFAGSSYLALIASRNAEPDLSPQSWTVLAQAGGAGPTGAAGTAATVSVGTVTTLAAGASATVSNVGSTSVAVLNFGIPQGAQGTAGLGGGTGSTTSSGTFGAMYHSVSFNTLYYAVNTTNASLSEATSVLAWVPQGCMATRLDVYSQQTATITATLRLGTPGSMSATSLSCPVATNSSCTATGSVAISAGQFIDLSIASASGTSAGVWTSLQCQ
jgi:hypothetical protein